MARCNGPTMQIPPCPRAARSAEPGAARSRVAAVVCRFKTCGFDWRDSLIPTKDSPAHSRDYARRNRCRPMLSSDVVGVHVARKRESPEMASERSLVHAGQRWPLRAHWATPSGMRGFNLPSRLHAAPHWPGCIVCLACPLTRCVARTFLGRQPCCSARCFWAASAARAPLTSSAEQ